MNQKHFNKRVKIKLLHTIPCTDLVQSPSSLLLCCSMCLSVHNLGVERQSDPAAPTVTSAGTIQGRCQDDPSSSGGSEESVAGADGHPRGDGGL